LGKEAHLLTPRDFRPCTLLGAVNVEIGNYDLGQSWYKKLSNVVQAKSQWMMTCVEFTCAQKEVRKENYATIS